MAETRKLLLYSNDPYGLGHFTRCLKVLNVFHRMYPTITSRVVTGSPIADMRTPPSGCEIVKLASITRDAVGNRRSRDPRYTFEEVKTMRREKILETTKDFQPDLFLMDTSILGSERECLPTLEWLKANTGTPIALGMRDISGNENRVRNDRDPDEIHRVLRDIYDAIFVYGPPGFSDPLEDFRDDEMIQAKTTFVGFITEPLLPDGGPMQIDTGSKHPKIFMTLGGGEDGEETINTFLDMVAAHNDALDANVFVLSGPLLPDEPAQRLAAKASQLGVRFERFVPDISPYLKDADLVVSKGGYNTVTEILTHASKALILAQATPRVEQLTRAEELADMDIVDYIPAHEATPDLLFEKVSRLLSRDDAPIAKAREEGLLTMNGAETVARACGPFLFGEAPSA